MSPIAAMPFRGQNRFAAASTDRDRSKVFRAFFNKGRKMKIRVSAPVFLVFVLCTLFFGGCAADPGGNTAENGDTAASAPEGHPTLIAHAGGAVYGYRYSNSLEALDSAYEGGFRFIELDMSLTADDEIVLIHDWDVMVKRMTYREGQLTKEEFLNLNVVKFNIIFLFSVFSAFMCLPSSR